MTIKKINIGLAISITILISFLLVGFNVKNGLAEIRFVIFSNYVSSESEFFQTIDHKINYVPSSAELDYSLQLNKQLNIAAMKSALGDLEYSINVINSFSRFGGRDGIPCGFSKNFSEAIDHSLQGFGCCADHVSIYRALVAGSGLKVREVHHQGHTFAEFYDSSRKMWIFIDPMLKVIALENGMTMSFEQMSHKVKAGGVLNIKSFGNGFNEEKREQHVFDYYKSAKNFNFMAYTNNKNPFNKNLNRKFESTYLRIVYQFYQFIFGPERGYITFINNKQKLMGYIILKYLFWSSFATFSILLFFRTCFILQRLARFNNLKEPF